LIDVKIPSFAQDSELLRGAFEFAEHVHRQRADDSVTDVKHPVAVARLLHDAGFDEEIVAVALLHEVIEDTSTQLDEVAERFGPRVAELVAAMTEDETIEPYEERKAEHRSRVAAEGANPAAIYAADKLAKVRQIRADSSDPGERKLAHYRQTLETLEATHPDLPFLSELRAELEMLAVDRQTASQ
jgi:(p)ppGpp synthase/HD superfamily hydrolase